MDSLIEQTSLSIYYVLIPENRRKEKANDEAYALLSGVLEFF